MWDDLLSDLKDAIEKEHSGAVTWDNLDYWVNKGYDGDVIVSDNIKEKYVKIYLYTGGKS